MRCLRFSIIVLLLCSFLADAALVRGAGRGSETSTSPQSYALYDNSFIRDGYLQAGAPFINRVSFTSGDLPLLAVPRDCWLIMPYDSFPPPEYWQEEPCYYEFLQGEQLDFESALIWDFPSAFAADFSWTLMQGEQSWTFAALRENGFNPAAVMPDELLPGAYSLTFNSTFYSGAERDFYYRNDRDECFPVFYEDEGDENCYYQGRRADVLSFSSPSEQVLILEPRAVQVPLPSTLSLFAGLGLLLFSRRKLFGTRQH
ncbi:MAG: hypothetical protein CML20_17810 [Rheinheimera sp.]|uniref:hypothetical protein n=1 Tax=Arsukibacterium sp. UBA3155 TaxID=1946058 RepID=UPI000C8BF0F7|nr:hypothetical protein [Arsukibacterium sp. UBA3155]MAD76615.1 hypothetical protein [Rheinheimera sp.]|tara:strand:+ start:36605 stop:37378 length:774 start_codon:yes stop_codon:yes gene_type:complete